MQAVVNNLTFGWMPVTDANTLIKTMQLVLQDSQGVINSLEIGVRRGETSRAIYQYFTESGRICFHTGIDNGHDVGEVQPFPECRMIIGNSGEVFNQIPDYSQNMIFVDANHAYPYSLVDFLVYSDKLRIGGLIAMHDTSPYIKPFTDWQHVGDKADHAMYISVRPALKKLGLLDNKFPGFELVFDEHDPQAPTGGITVFKRLA